MLRLIGTTLSHFTRKVRIVLHELGIPFQFEVVSGLLQTDAASYGGNPLLRVPTLIDGAQWVIESDHIARHLVRTRAPHDPLAVMTSSVEALNRLAAINGVMGHEVTWILAERAGMQDALSHGYFQKIVQSMRTTLAWLDQGTKPQRAGFDYGDIALVCLWQHLTHYAMLPGLQDFPRIAQRVAQLADRPSVASTTPQASLQAVTG